MDIGTLRGIITAILLVSFVGLIGWAYSKRRRPDFDEAANLPFADEEEWPQQRDSSGAENAASRQEKGDSNT
ncbi:cbb3-type cytochrome oxidase subunit 3 [Halomonas organivorans]|uniref:Cytochrome c oxidase cbb3-type subunit 4 n=1 Tax=Halomonas organivorans TaxID=257772 RepID=A0A7W5C131_9GAMM|nr:cbb3-type cytochrome c oxidase subunit 3 [Halomonas organivorans]MBB3142931.1 cytochrome c oxidase cbb3-type subunit 4 [Halomonas organivorans]